MSWFDKLMPSRINTEKRRRSVPEGLWVKCEGCSAQLYRTELKRNLNVCPKCAHHHYIGARERLNAFLDPDSAEEIGANLEPQDPLKFKDSKRYRDRLSQAQKATGERDALIVMSGALKGMPVVAAAFEFHFMAGSMGSVVGERFARGVYRSIEQERPFVCFAASGGARMQESLYSLLQMGKTSAALAALAEARLPYISVMTDPTTGGVSASLAFLGDVNIAEPGALIGFAGPRVIEQTVKETLPDGFQRAEFLLEKGALDMIVDRRRSRDEIAALLTKLTFYRRSAAAAATAAAAAAAAAKPTAAEAPPQTLLEPSGGSAASSEPSPSADAQTAAGGQRAADAGKARPAKVRGPKLRRSRGRAAAPEPDPRTAPAPAPGQPNSGDNAPSPQAANPPETAAPTDPPGAPSTRDAGAAPPPDAHGAIPARAPGAAGAVPSDARGATSREAPGGGQADPGTSPDAHDMSRQSAGTAGTAGAAGSPAPAGAERLRGTAAEPPREDRLGPEGRSGVTPGHDPSGTPGAKLEVRRGDAVHGDAGSETHEPGAAHEADAAYEPGTRAADHEATGGPPPPNAGGRAQPSGHAAGAAAAEPPGSHAEPPSSDGEPPGSYVEPPSSHMEPGPHAGSAGATGSASAPGRTGGIAGQPPAAAGTDDARSSGPSGNAGSPSTPAASVGHASTQGAAPPQDQATSTDEGTPSGQAPSASPITSSRQATPSDKATSSDQTTPSGQAAPPSGHPPAVGEGRPASQSETPEPGDAGRGGALDEHAGDGRPGDDPERRAAARTEASPHRDAAGDSDSSSHES